MRRRGGGQRILLTIGSARLGGAEGQMVRLGCELARRGHEVRFVFSEAGGSLTRTLDVSGITWSIARRGDWPRSSTLRRVLGVLRLARVLVQYRPTVVMAWLPTAIWPTLLLGRWLTRARLVAGIRGEIFDDALSWQRRWLRKAFGFAHVVTVNSPHLAQTASRWGVDPDRVVLVPNGVSIPPWDADTATAPPRAVVVANYRWYKGHDTLLEAIARSTADFSVRLCGEGDTAAFAALADQLGITDRVTFVPDPADVPHELRQAQFAIHPSTQEGLSNAILEQLAAGLPVVATDVGGSSLLVESGTTGYLVPASDPDAMAAAIDKVAGSASDRARMGQASRRHAHTFDWAACAARYEVLFEGGRQLAPVAHDD